MNILILDKDPQCLKEKIDFVERMIPGSLAFGETDLHQTQEQLDVFTPGFSFVITDRTYRGMLTTQALVGIIPTEAQNCWREELTALLSAMPATMH